MNFTHGFFLSTYKGAKNLFPGLSNSEVHWYFYVPKRERERRGERGGERGEREREKREERREKREEKREMRDERASERDNKSAGDYISKPPGPGLK